MVLLAWMRPKLVHFWNIVFQFLNHKWNIWLRFWRQFLFILNGLILQIKNHDIFIHSFPSGGVNFVPKLFLDPYEKGKKVHRCNLSAVVTGSSASSKASSEGTAEWVRSTLLRHYCPRRCSPELFCAREGCKWKFPRKTKAWLIGKGL